MKKNLPKYLLVLLLLIMGGLIFNHLNNTLRKTNGSLLSANLSDISTASNTVYKDFSELSEIDNKYSYSTLFYSKNTKFYVKNNSGNVYYRTDALEDGKVSPYVRLLSVGDEAEIVITNAAIDDNNNILDVVFKVTLMEAYEDPDDTTAIRGDFHIRPYEFNNGEQNHPKICEPDKDFVPNCITSETIKYGDPIEFGLTTHRAAVKVELTYYKDLKLKNIEEGKYTTKYSTTTTDGLALDYAEVDTSNSVIATNINKINSIYSDLDTITQPSMPSTAVFGGNEGIAPINGSTTLYYNKNHKNDTFDYPEFGLTGARAKLAEGDNGIHIEDFWFRYTDSNNNTVSNITGKWYGTTAELLTNNVSGTYKFVYGGYHCGIYFSFMSPTGYSIDDPIKKVSKTVVKPNETFTFEVSQYIPNNYYSNRLNFFTVYPNLNHDNLVSSLAFSDDINSGLTIDNSNIKVEDINGNDLTNLFNVSVNNNITVINNNNASTYFSTPTAYNNIITLKIPVKYTGKVERELTIPNTGVVALGIGNVPAVQKRTNEVEVAIKPIKLTYDCVTNGGEPTFDPTVYIMQPLEEADLSKLCKKPDNKFIGWSTSPDGEIIDKFIMPDTDAIIYGLYEPYNCDMSISSDKYKIDKEKKIIYVDKNDSVEEIEKHITSVEKIVVTMDDVTIICNEERDTYTISRYWSPKTGKTVIRYGLIIGVVLVLLLALIFVLNRKRK